MQESRFSPRLLLALTISLWLLGLIIISMTAFAAGSGLELYKGMNLSLPLPTRLFIVMSAPLRVSGGSWLVALLWTGFTFAVERKRNARTPLDDLALKILILSGLHVVAGAALIAGWLPLFQMIGDVG